MFRIAAEESIPHHFEAVPLRRRFSALGWLLALGTVAIGLWLAATAYGLTADLLAPFVVIAGGLLGLLVARCRRHELTVGTKRVDLKIGPIERLVPTAAIESVGVRPARGWRRMFAEREIVLNVAIGRPVVCLPSLDPEPVRHAMDELR